MWEYSVTLWKALGAMPCADRRFSTPLGRGSSDSGERAHQPLAMLYNMNKINRLGDNQKRLVA